MPAMKITHKIKGEKHKIEGDGRNAGGRREIGAIMQSATTYRAERRRMRQRGAARAQRNGAEQCVGRVSIHSPENARGVNGDEQAMTRRVTPHGPCSTAATVRGGEGPSPGRPRVRVTQAVVDANVRRKIVEKKKLEGPRYITLEVFPFRLDCQQTVATNGWSSLISIAAFGQRPSIAFLVVVGDDQQKMPQN
ncbi:hypothetical protein C8F04DRAFT_1190454 [Mycena alexandri]|uniref:Uncharacterized protein n=1 Tax=Mycena alexandri TaxID=1745969 RepID=A0AAD6SEJ4_9AGAR|nr:hypothetical protein C8F04DRAFT_1190454 [Mycena alexandri]